MLLSFNDVPLALTALKKFEEVAISCGEVIPSIKKKKKLKADKTNDTKGLSKHKKKEAQY